MQKVYLSILYLNAKTFEVHCKKTVTLTVPRCGEVFVVTEVERFGTRVKYKVVMQLEKIFSCPRSSL
jgi:hypothetical protein